MVAKGPKVVHGDDLLYRFFQSLLEDRPDLAPELLGRMYCTMGVWFPLDVYHDYPVLLPWVVRDHTCRGDKKKGEPDQWGSPNADGFLRDDNSLVKSLTRSLDIRAPGMSQLHGARIGTEFVASHVWREVKHPSLASRHPLLNSFVPNLVWLPSQVSKLTDREGEVMQRALQALAWKVYRTAPVAPHLRDIVDEAWDLIPQPAEIPVNVPELNTFISTERFRSTRRDRLRSVIAATELIEGGQSLPAKVVTKRYSEGLPRVEIAQLIALRSFLKRFDVENSH